MESACLLGCNKTRINLADANPTTIRNLTLLLCIPSLLSLVIGVVLGNRNQLIDKHGKKNIEQSELSDAYSNALLCSYSTKI